MEGHQKQLRNNNCGQTCVAMLTGVTQWDAMNAVGQDGGTNSTLLKNALFKFGYDVEVVRGKKNWPPKTALLLIKWKNRGYGHVVLLKDGLVHDPSWDQPWDLGLYEMALKEMGGRITSYINVKGKRVV